VKLLIKRLQDIVRDPQMAHSMIAMRVISAKVVAASIIKTKPVLAGDGVIVLAHPEPSSLLSNRRNPAPRQDPEQAWQEFGR